MKVFGGILPFIGFRTHEVDPDMRRVFNIHPSVHEVTFFELEWLWFGWGIALIPPHED